MHQDHHHHDRFGNPEDLNAYVERLDSPERNEWQKPDKVVNALGLQIGNVIGEIGPGTGYFTSRLARAVDVNGRVYAAEVEPKMAKILQDRMDQEKISNITAIACSQADPLFPKQACDVILVVNTFHHLPNPTEYLAGLQKYLKPQGRIAIIDFLKQELPVGPPLEEKLSRDELAEICGKAGYEISKEHTFLPYQYFVECQLPHG